MLVFVSDLWLDKPQVVAKFGQVFKAILSGANPTILEFTATTPAL
jgi:hypothetical protein